jgi:hypothetical protein
MQGISFDSLICALELPSGLEGLVEMRQPITANQVEGFAIWRKALDAA